MAIMGVQVKDVDGNVLCELEVPDDASVMDPPGVSISAADQMQRLPALVLLSEPDQGREMKLNRRVWPFLPALAGRNAMESAGEVLQNNVGDVPPGGVSATIPHPAFLDGRLRE